jgi:hypothetical protein
VKVRALALAVLLALPGGVARAESFDGGLVLEVKSAVLTLPDDAVVRVDGGVYMDEEAAVRIGRELRASRSSPVQPASKNTALAILIVAGVCFAGGLTLGLLASR